MKIDKNVKYLEHIIELDFKYFYLLVCDFKALRVLLVLKGQSSDRLKKQLYLFTVGVYSQFSEDLEKFTGKIQIIENNIIYFINQFLYLHYNDVFNLTKDQNRLNEVKNSGNMTKLELEVLSWVEKTTRKKNDFLLSDIVKQLKEDKVDLVYEALLSLISMKVIIPLYYEDLALKE
jgi:hypothetical protein